MNAQPIPLFLDIDGVLVVYRHAESEQARLDRELMEKVYPDPVLLRATDILLGIKATVSCDNKTTTNTPTPAGSR